MATGTNRINVSEAVSVFDSFETLEAAIFDLPMSEYGRSDISLLGGKEAIGKPISLQRGVAALLNKHMRQYRRIESRLDLMQIGTTTAHSR